MKRSAFAMVLVPGLLWVSQPALASGPNPAISGKYRTKVATNALNGALKGTWTLNFKGGVLIASKGGKRQGQDEYSVNGNRVAFRPSGACPGKGTYHYTVSAQRLSLTRIKDSCVVRRTILSHRLMKLS